MGTTSKPSARPRNDARRVMTKARLEAFSDNRIYTGLLGLGGKLGVGHYVYDSYAMFF